MKTFFFQSQAEYQNGGFMCTSACVCMCMMYLGRNVDLQNWAESAISKRIRSVMLMSSHVHSKVEKLSRSHTPVGNPRMFSTFEIFSTLGLTMEKLGVASEELVICSSIQTPNKFSRQVPLLHRPDTCFIRLNDLPKCMLSEGEEPVCCVLTCRGHSIAVLQDGRGNFSIFDPLPSSLVTNMTAVQALEVRTVHSIPDI